MTLIGSVRERVAGAARVLAGAKLPAADGKLQATAEGAGNGAGGRRTAGVPSIFSRPGAAGAGALGPGTGAGGLNLPVPRASAAQLRRFAETPVARRALNVVKNRIAGMDWQIRLRRGCEALVDEGTPARMQALRHALEEPNSADSFRTLFEAVLEDTLVGGFGSVEVRLTGDPARPFELYAVDGAAIGVDPAWDGDPERPRYSFGVGVGTAGSAGVGATPLLDRELMYVRLNPRTHTAFGLGRLEVAFESVAQLLSASRYAGRLASNSVVQYALWLDEATPEEHDRLIRWWQDEIEGTGRVPVLSCEKKPEVLRFAGGTDADLRLEWQQFLIRMIANAFDLPPMLLGLSGDVNRATAGEMADEAFRSGIVPVARLLAEHITRDLFAKALGWREFEFAFNELEARDEQTEANLQVQLLNAGVLSIAEVRAQRGLPALPVELAGGAGRELEPGAAPGAEVGA